MDKAKKAPKGRMTAFRRYETQKLYPSPAMDTDTSAPIIYVLIHAGKYYFLLLLTVLPLTDYLPDDIMPT